MAGYLAFLFCCSVIGALSGLAAHIWRAEVGDGTGANEDPVFEKGFLVVLAPHEDRALEKRAIKADWNENGWWDGYSLSNMAYYVGGGAAAPWIWGLLMWNSQDETMAAICGSLASTGITPLFCSFAG